MKILIIGNSAAGTAAIEGIRKHDTESQILQLTDETHPLYSRCLLSYYIGGKIDKAVLSYREPDFHKRMSVELKPGAYVAEVDPAAQRVMCLDGSTHAFDKLLISTGSSAKIPDVVPADLNGVFVLRTIADAELIKQRVLHAKSAVILGGGLVGMRAADALSQCGLKVRIVIGSNRILSRMIDFDAAQIIRRKLEKNSIQIMTGTNISEVMHKGNEVIGVTTDQGQSLDCEILVVAKSVQANTALIQQTDIKTRWGIETDSFMQTSHENIYAAGDVAETFDIAMEEYTVNSLWTCAVQQGKTAGENIAGKRKQYVGSVGMNSLNFWGIPLISFGITAPKDESRYEILCQSWPERNIYKKVVIEQNRIKGLILVGEIANAGVLYALIQNKMDVSAFKDDLLGTNFNFGKVIRHGSKPALEGYYRGLSA